MFQNNLFAGRTIFLTGGGTGLGRSMALRMAGLGAKLFLVGRREEPLREVAAEIRAANGACSYATADVRDYAAVELAVAAAEKQFGPVDTLINNAARKFHRAHRKNLAERIRLTAVVGNRPAWNISLHPSPRQAMDRGTPARPGAE